MLEGEQNNALPHIRILYENSSPLVPHYLQHIGRGLGTLYGDSESLSMVSHIEPATISWYALLFKSLIYNAALYVVQFILYKVGMCLCIFTSGGS